MIFVIIFTAFMFLLPLGLAFYWGYVGGTLAAPITIAVLMSLFNVRDGWREGGIIKSMFLGTLFSAIVVVPTYYAGKWLGGL
jgi:hypothetical protein